MQITFLWTLQNLQLHWYENLKTRKLRRLFIYLFFFCIRYVLLPYVYVIRADPSGLTV